MTTFDKPIVCGRVTNLTGYTTGEQYVINPYVSAYEDEADEYRLTIQTDPDLLSRIEEAFREDRGFGRADEVTQNWRDERTDDITIRSVMKPRVSPGLDYQPDELDLTWRIDPQLFCVAGARPERITYENLDGSVKELETLVLVNIEVYKTFEDAYPTNWESLSSLSVDF